MCAVAAAHAQVAQGLVLDDAERFATLLKSPDLPTAAQLQSAYLDPGSAGVRIFTPHRIRDAATLAHAVAKNPDAYRRALRLCLPVARQLQAEAADIARRIGALLGSTGTAAAYVVLGAGNSGGTASAEGLVLGLGLAHEAQLWREFSAALDRRQGLAGWLYGPAAQSGRPADMGYWIGKRICQACMADPARAADPAKALQTLLLLRDPLAILRDSGYGQHGAR